MIKRHIAANLETGALAAHDLCRRFHISRASLYRLFEADGGPARYVQGQRLNRALTLLVSPASRDRRLIDLAVDLQFSSDSTFIARSADNSVSLPRGQGVVRRVAA